MTWEPSLDVKYTGLHGGPYAGPTKFIVDIVCSAKGLADFFFAVLPLAFIEIVAQLTTKHSYDNWVVQRRNKDSDGDINFILFRCHLELMVLRLPTDVIGLTRNQCGTILLQESPSHGLRYSSFN
jgi:hypothetical protein